MRVPTRVRPISLQRGFAALFMSLGVACMSAAAAPEDAPKPLKTRRIVLLHGTDGRSTGQIQASAAFRDSLTRDVGMAVEVYNEDLDLTRFDDPTVEAAVIALLLAKHRGRPPELVVAFGSPALAFAERQHERLWPEAELMFMGVDDLAYGEIGDRRAVTGTVLHLPATATLQLGLALRPQTRRLVVIGGTSEIDRAYLRAVRAELDATPSPVPVEYMMEMPLTEILARVRAIPRDSLVMPISLFRDAAGQNFPAAAAVTRVGAESRAPVLAVAENYVNGNVLGGRIARFGDHGREAGEIAAAILNGRDPRSIPVRRPASSCIVDWRELGRWSIDPGRVPADCEVANRTYTAWEEHGGTALIAAAIILLQGFLISVLVVQRRRSRIAEEKSQRQQAQLAHVARLATVGELTASIAHEINQPLGAILLNADAAELMLESANPDLEEVRHALADIRRDDERASAVIQRLRELLARHEIVRERLDPNGIVEEALTLVTQQAERRETRLEVFLDPSVPPVLGDRVHLVQVMIILIINALDALDATAPAKRRVVVSTGTFDSMVEISVRDTGPGIAESDFARLFEPFFSTKPKGMGLGLSIARSIVEAHGGRIWAENRGGGGAIFLFHLAAAR